MISVSIKSFSLSNLADDVAALVDRCVAGFDKCLVFSCGKIFGMAPSRNLGFDLSRDRLLALKIKNREYNAAIQ